MKNIILLETIVKTVHMVQPVIIQIVNALMEDIMMVKYANIAHGEQMEHIQIVYVEKMKRMCK